MKVMTVLGTRPEIIRLSLLIPLLDESCDHILVHTGQNFDPALDEIFFNDLSVRAPDVNLGVRGAFAAQVGAILVGVEALLQEHRPDRLLILGDTNSGLAAMVAKRMGISVYHMEAGNRCYDDRVPEEVNRRIIDHCSTVLMPYTSRSRANLVREGIHDERIYTTGNPIKQVLDHFADRIDSSKVLAKLQLSPGEYCLATMHRAENVDKPERLKALVDALANVASHFGFPIVCSVHPRTAARIKLFGVSTTRDGLRLLEPMSLFDFVSLEKSAFCCLSDSGTVQEETCIFGVPNVTIREVTERPETVECGSNFIAGTDPDAILRAVTLVTSRRSRWTPPPEYLAQGVAEACCRIVLNFRIPDRSEVEWASSARDHSE
jgi:UDP-N-acetylglucosamine 2-epimerase (non-hydrolysing)